MTTVPTVYTYTAFELLTAAKMNAFVRDALQFILTPPAFILQRAAVQSIPNATATGISWDTELGDRDDGHSNGTNPDRYTSQTTGWYDLDASVPVAMTSTTGSVRAFFEVNGSSSNRFGMAAVPAANDTVGPAISTKVYLTAGDYVRVCVVQTNGGARNTATADGGPMLSGQWATA